MNDTEEGLLRYVLVPDGSQDHLLVRPLPLTLYLRHTHRHPYVLSLTVFILIAWLWHCSKRTAIVKAYHSASTARIGLTGKTLLDIVREGVPSLLGENASFRPHPWFSGAHAQTIYASLNACASETVVYERKVLRLPDGGTISLDFYPSLAEHPLCDDEPIVIALSGLTGGSDESYIIELMKGLRTRSSDGPSLRGVVCNFRGCAGTPLTTPRLYHGGTTDDLRCAILYLTTTFPNRRLFGVGFSLGSNLLVKYAGEEGESCPLSGIISLANIWDYVQGMKHIESGTWINRFFYQYVLGHSLRRLVRANLSAFTRPCTSSGPTLSTTEAPFTTTTSLLNPSRLHAFLTTLFIPFRTFIQLFTCDLHGFVNPEDYYAKVSCVRYLERVEVPCLAVNSMDDPFVPPDCLPLCQTLNSKWVVLAATEKGGHVGWIEKDGGRWYIRPAREFIHALLKSDLPLRPTPRIRVKWGKHGPMTYDKSNADIGFRELTTDEMAVKSKAPGFSF